ncbi:hypothetical protein FDH96_gp129 [Mycobacterium phage Rey]|uniref:Uncharacterized protein n=1 Tax=Mycobacterium phage Rey TaxID=1034115 RepID=G1D5J0_9CAUD|nr:hypothetical protein FDH96_gp129 [Mycobacterium phage Rey]AEK10038.1 hypothetical protein PBI_REY_150 [Mycobacterium phage Rey]
MTAPAWTWTDTFGDTLEIYEAGAHIVLGIKPKNDDEDDQAIALDIDQMRGLRAALGVCVRERSGI